MKNAAVVNFGLSGLVAAGSWAVLSAPFLPILLLAISIVHTFRFYHMNSNASSITQPPVQNDELKPTLTLALNLNAEVILPKTETHWNITSVQTSLEVALVDQSCQYDEEIPVTDTWVQTTTQEKLSHDQFTQTFHKTFSDSETQPDPDQWRSEVSVQSEVQSTPQESQYEVPVPPRNVQVQTHIAETRHQFAQSEAVVGIDEETEAKAEVSIERIPCAHILSKEDYIMFEDEEVQEQGSYRSILQEPEVASAPILEESKAQFFPGYNSELSNTKVDRILREIQVDTSQLFPIAEEKPPQLLEEEPIPMAKMVYVNPLVHGNGKLLNSVLLSNTTSMEDKGLYGFFLCLSELEVDQYFGALPYDNENVYVYPVYPQPGELPKEEETLSTWMLCSHISDYIVLLIDLKTYPELRYSEQLYKLFKFLETHGKAMFVLHAVYSDFTFDDSSRKFTELIEQYSNKDDLVHFELGTNLATNIDILQTIRDQMSEHFRTEMFDVRYKAALEVTVNELYVIKSSRGLELPIEESDISLEQLREGWLSTVTLESTWTCTIREQYVKIVPEMQVLISSLRYILDDKLACEVKLASITMPQTYFMRCAVFTNHPGALTFKQLHVISSFMVNLEDKSILILPYEKYWNRGLSNHINTPLFDSMFIGQFMRSLANCLILNLYYHNGELVEPEDKFLTLSAVIRAHYKEVELRGAKKPILIIHNLNIEGDLDAIYAAFKVLL